MKRFEYLPLTYQYPIQLDVLDTWGKGGWELCIERIVKPSFWGRLMGAKEIYLYTFKREITETR